MLVTPPPQAVAVLNLARDLFGDDLIGLYLHGSIVTGGLRPSSDLDLMIVLSRPLAASERHELLARLLAVSSRYPARGPDRRCLEVMVVDANEVRAPHDPARCDFMYGEWLRADFERGSEPLPFADPVVTLLLAQARTQSQALLGPRFAQLAGLVSFETLHRALRDSLPALLGDLNGDERNVLLTLARMWRTADRGDFVSKDVAAEWAAARSPAPVAATLVEAAGAYRGERVDDWVAMRQEAEAAASHLAAAVRAALHP